MKKAKGGSKKGTPFENEMCKEISWWWSWGARGDLVRRTKSSGGWATERSKQDLPSAYQYGDLSPTHPDIYPLFDFFLFEAKRGYSSSLDVLELVDLPGNLKQRPQMELWWEKAEVDRKAGGKKEIIFLIKRDHRNRIVAISKKLRDALKIETGKSILANNSIFIMDMAEFFAILEPETIPVLLKEYEGQHS